MAVYGITSFRGYIPRLWIDSTVIAGAYGRMSLLLNGLAEHENVYHSMTAVSILGVV